MSILVFRAGLLDYTQIIDKGGSGPRGKSFIELLGQIWSLLMPGRIGFWIVLGVVVLLVVHKIRGGGKR